MYPEKENRRRVPAVLYLSKEYKISADPSCSVRTNATKIYLHSEFSYKHALYLNTMQSKRKKIKLQRKKKIFFVFAHIFLHLNQEARTKLLTRHANAGIVG